MAQIWAVAPKKKKVFSKYTITRKCEESCDFLIWANNSFNRPNFLDKIFISIKFVGFEVLKAVTL
jgi:hypothetical protein